MPSARLPELAALDRMFGIEGAEGRSEPREMREMRDNEIISGDIVAEFTDRSGHEKYVVETDQNAYVAIPKASAPEFSVGDSIEATRTGSTYDIAIEHDYGI